MLELYVHVQVRFKMATVLEEWKLLEPLHYSPDLAPSDFHLFGPLKTHLGGQHFVDDEKFEHEVQMWLRLQTKILRH